MFFLPHEFFQLYRVNKKIVYDLNSINCIPIQFLFNSTYQLTSVNINCICFFSCLLLTLFRVGFFGAAYGWRGRVLKSVTHILQS